MMNRNQRGEEEMSNSVEWLIEKCACADLRPELWEIIKQQAKAMHKEEIKIAYYNGTTDEIKTKDELLLDAEHYYNETYGDESNP
jgi:hypothetical protein